MTERFFIMLMEICLQINSLLRMVSNIIWVLTEKL